MGGEFEPTASASGAEFADSGDNARKGLVVGGELAFNFGFESIKPLGEFEVGGEHCA